MYDGEKTIKQESRDKFTDCFKVLDEKLKGNKWITGDNLTIADISLLATIVTVVVINNIQTNSLHCLLTFCVFFLGIWIRFNST